MLKHPTLMDNSFPDQHDRIFLYETKILMKPIEKTLF